jgi:hypothetical protein
MEEKKTKKSKIEGAIETMLILTCVTLLVVFVINFMSAFHNVDLVTNIEGLVCDINSAGFSNSLNQTLFIPRNNLTDTGSDFETRPLTAYYIASMNGLQKYFILACVDMLLLGLLLGRKL